MPHGTTGPAYVINTSDYPSLQPGYCSVAVGLYASSDGAIGYCTDHGLRRYDCYAVLLDNKPAPGTRRYP